MQVSSPAHSVSTPPAKPRPPEKNRSQEHAAEQQRAAARAQQNENQPKPVVNTQGQSTGRIVNTKA